MPYRDVGHCILIAGWLRGYVMLCLSVHEARDMG